MATSCFSRALLGLAGALWLAAPSLAQPPGGVDHHHHQHGERQAMPAPASHAGHAHDLGPAGATYDLRFIDGMVQHHTGALRMSEFLFDVGQPGVGALAKSTNPTIRRFARGVITAQRAEILQLRRMLAVEGLRKPDYHRYDALFGL